MHLAFEHHSYAYDNEGNLLSRTPEAGGAPTTYIRTAEHQLIGISYPDGTTTSYKYDPFGRLVETDEGINISRYAHDYHNLAAEYDGTNTLTATYTQNPMTTNRVLEIVRGGQRYFYLTDAQHSTTALTTIAGTVAASYAYTASGAPTEIGTLSNPLTYTGQLYEG